MYSRSIKTNIAVNIAVLLLVAMILIDLVMVLTIQKDFVQSQISKGYLLTSTVEREFMRMFDVQKTGLRLELVQEFNGVIKDFKAYSLLVMNGDAKQVYSYDEDKKLHATLRKLALQSLRSGEKTNKMIGSTWGVFWKQRQFLIISTPLYKEDKTIASMSVAFQLDEFYGNLRKTQQFVLVYVLTNAVILTFAGLYVIYRITGKPLNKLVERAEEYKDDDGFGFLYEKEKNEFGQLSQSLNQMLQRIADDKCKLKTSLESLERANTELKKAQDEIIRTEKLASVGRLSAGIAHEIGNPIGVVLGYLELLQQEDLDEEKRKDFILRAEEEINRISMIIRQLLNFSRPSNEIAENVSVHEIIEEIVNTLEIQPIMASIDIKLSLLADDYFVLADPHQLRQIFLNFMINAADAISSQEGPGNGEIMINTTVAKGSNNGDGKPLLEIKFADNGGGIPQEDLNNVFDPFYTTKEPGKGTGLGLSVCFMIVDKLGGSIKAESEYGEGTTMTVCLPLAKTKAS